MEESSELRKLHAFGQGLVYFSIIVEAGVFLFHDAAFLHLLQPLLRGLARLPVYGHVYYAKAFTLALLLIVSLGTRARKDLDLDPLKHIIMPLLLGLALFLGAGYFYFHQHPRPLLGEVSVSEAAYVLLSFIGATRIHIALDNVSKHVQHRLLDDRFNIENESFAQSARRLATPYSVNIPMRYYHQGRMRRGWLNLVNPFRGTLLIGTPGSGKSYSIVVPFIRQMLAKGFSMMVYDFKFPDLARVAYAHYLAGRKRGVLGKHGFHVINFNSISHSSRCNPLKPAYLPTLADATETAEALLEALRKGDRGTGTAQFFNQSAVNFLAGCMYFLSRYEQGRYSSFPHVLAFLNLSYEQVFEALFSEPELESLLSPFASAYRHGAFEQLEGQIGTLKINIGRLATKETFWVLSGDDFNLRLSDPESPSVLVLANDPATQSVNSACNALIMNRITRLINTRGNLPCGLIVDESPTLYVHRVENLMATARSNRIAVLLGLQELPQLRQQYGRETADTICAVAANVLSGSARHRETLDWLEKLFGRVRQLKQGISVDRSRTATSLQEEMGPLIPAARIAGLQTGEIVGQVATENGTSLRGAGSGHYHCRLMPDQDPLGARDRLAGELPVFYHFDSAEEKERVLRENYERIRQEVQALAASLEKSAGAQRSPMQQARPSR